MLHLNILQQMTGIWVLVILQLEFCYGIKYYINYYIYSVLWVVKLQSIKINQYLKMKMRKFSVSSPLTTRISRLDFVILVSSITEIRTVAFFRPYIKVCFISNNSLEAQDWREPQDVIKSTVAFLQKEQLSSVISDRYFTIWFLRTLKDEDSTNLLGNLFQCFTLLPIKLQFLPIISWHRTRRMDYPRSLQPPFMYLKIVLFLQSSPFKAK